MPSPIISPASPLTRDGGELVDFTSNQNVTWATSGGTLVGIAAQSVTWEAPNATGVWTVSADNGPDPATVVSITVRAIVPNLWGWETPRHAKKNVLIFTPIFGPTQTRSFGNSPAIHDWELSGASTTLESILEMKEFWDYHHPGRQFDLIDPLLSERRRYETDSDFDFHPDRRHANSWAWSCRIKEAYPFAIIS